jgi:hypothetical protein
MVTGIRLQEDVIYKLAFHFANCAAEKNINSAPPSELHPDEVAKKFFEDFDNFLRDLSSQNTQRDDPPQSTNFKGFKVKETPDPFAIW